MSKKTIAIIITIVLILLLLALVGYYFIINKNSPDGGGLSGFKSFLPFGGGSSSTTDNENNQNNNSNNQNQNNNQDNQDNQQDFVKKLRELSTEPISGAGITDIKAGSVVRYTEKATGHIYEVEMFSPKKERISNTTIPLAYEAVWGNSNISFIARYLVGNGPAIDTYSISLKLSTTTSITVKQLQFPENIISAVTFGDSVFYLQSDSIGSYGYITNFDGLKGKQVWSSTFKDLLAQYVNSKTVILTSMPYEGLDGFSYKIDLVTGKSKKILGPIAGLSTLVNPDESIIMYLKQDGEARVYTYNTKNKTTTPTPVDFQTFPEKCAWGKKDTGIVYCAIPNTGINNSSLTSWYKGIISTNDSIWKYDIKNNTYSNIAELTAEAGENIDVINPIISDNDQYLIFTNKKNGTLWSLDLTK